MHNKPDTKSNTNHYENMLGDFIVHLAEMILKLAEMSLKCLWLMLKELLCAFKRREIPWTALILSTFALSTALTKHWDYRLFEQLEVSSYYPSRFSPLLYQIYFWAIASSPIWTWLLVRVSRRQKLERQFEEVFTCAGLKNRMGQVPRVIFNADQGNEMTLVRLSNANFPIESFEEAKESIEGGLGVYIDSIEENRTRNTIDITYGKQPMQSLVTYESEWSSEYPPDVIPVGFSRSRVLQCDLSETPHLLVAGETSSGKSSFLRQAITTLYCINEHYDFTLIDLKGSLEFQLFHDLPRVSVISDANRAVTKLRTLEEELKRRMAQLAQSGAKDLASQSGQGQRLSRHLIVIDEAAELFLPGAGAGGSKAAREIVGKIARQGRAVGLHLIIATQRPDARAVDTQIKSNLPGKLCFKMADNSSSMVVLGNGRAKQLPNIPGRAIWQCGLENIEIQTPLLSVDQAEEILRPHRSKQKISPEHTDSSPVYSLSDEW